MENDEYKYHIYYGDYDWWQVGMRKSTMAMLSDNFKNKIMLDCGSGSGYFVRDARKKSICAFGVELNKKAINFCNDVHNSKWFFEDNVHNFFKKKNFLILFVC